MCRQILATASAVTREICTEATSAATRDALKRLGEELSLHDDGQPPGPRDGDDREDEPPG